MDLLQLWIVILRHKLLGGLDSLFGFCGIDIEIHSHPSFIGLALLEREC